MDFCAAILYNEKEINGREKVMSKKIVVIGAGHGGLCAAALLAKNGYDVSVYEKGKRGEISYPWKDTLVRGVFSEVGLKEPPKETHCPEPSWTFIPPSGKDEITIPENPQTGNISMDRRTLAEHLISVAEESGAKLYFESAVSDLQFSGDAVCGIIMGEEKISADLVIDASGLLSPFRGKIPQKFGLQVMPDKDGVMVAWRGRFRRKEGSSDPENKNRLFLRPKNLNGICWCVLDDDDTVDVLIGQIGGLGKEERDDMLAYIREQCEIMPDEEPFEGRYASICVRYAMPVLVADGYVLVGDSSCLTMPIIGCGITYAIQEGALLADLITKGEIKDFDAKSLWKYNVGVIKKYGSVTIGLDVLKRAILTVPEKMINDVFATHIFTGELMFGVIRGSFAAAFKPKTLATILKNLKTLIPVVKFLLPSLKNSGKAKKVAKRIPQKYGLTKIFGWKDKYDGFFK